MPGLLPYVAVWMGYGNVIYFGQRWGGEMAINSMGSSRQGILLQDFKERETC